MHALSHYPSDDSYLPFLTLGVTAGVSRFYLPTILNSSSIAVNIPLQFSFGTNLHTLVYVSKYSSDKYDEASLHFCIQLTSNGYFSFGREAHLFDPILFPESNFYNSLVAPYWVDHDIRLSGRISYEVHTTFTALMSYVNEFIQHRGHEDFIGRWMMIAEFKEAPQYDSRLNRVCMF